MTSRRAIKKLPLGMGRRRAIIVGAGQSGLAVAAALVEGGLTPQHEFVIIDASSGETSWANRWHSMVLLSDARHSTLVGYPTVGNQRRHLTANEMSRYLADTAARIGVKPLWRTRAIGVERRGAEETTLVLSTSVGDVQTRNVVCATGAASRPRRPQWFSGLDVPGMALHSSDYHDPKQLPPGDVLIVGGGNTGVQLARELNDSHTVTLSVRTPRRRHALAFFPHSSGRYRHLIEGKRQPEPLYTDSYQSLRRDGIAISSAVTSAHGPTVSLADGSTLRPTSVIAATGYLPGDDWLPDHAHPTGHHPTQTTIPGLTVAGMPRFSRPGSDTIHGIHRDALLIARSILDRP
ncbi:MULTISPECIES: NAD(P)-binding domain-containing protein [Micrococcales]|jgi:putative flavoprotein involved in K+ transport|uniref:Flavoprotein involved in K+ transport n=1 Tax=Arthrobacter russicus TaxID=172040 RepID=A0ABU1J7R1_9MICC|nr:MULTISPECIES: NAD(P)/FAD-dependent oxidoreductase [Micrococcales]MDR6268466.1 putative flavoprotein involved in K+ transport [Arthrobacter russicus]RBO70822.1 NAD(P)/FAD-dependent oxidoreductase [Microbacterium sp. H6]